MSDTVFFPDLFSALLPPWLVIQTGIDVVQVARLQAALERWPRLAARLFTAEELRYAATRPHPAESLAARFAAKEATMKALGEGWPKVSWQDIEIVRGEGRPELKLTGRAAALAGDGRLAVSLAHDGGVAVAQVILEAAP